MNYNMKEILCGVKVLDTGRTPEYLHPSELVRDTSLESSKARQSKLAKTV